MNKSRRKRIAAVINTLENAGYDIIESARDEIEDILWEEEDAYDNMPENLQCSMRGEESSEAIDNLQEAVDKLEEAIEVLEEINNMDKEDEDYETEKESKEEDINDYINDAISSLEDIY